MKVLLYESLWENDINLNYQLSKQLPNEFKISGDSLKSFSTKHDVHFVNFGPI